MGRWFAVAQHSGVAILEADDPVLVQRLALEWNDLMRMEVSPALTDEQITPLMAAAVER